MWPSSGIGALEFQMLADLGRLRQDMAQAKGIVGDAAKSIQNTINSVGGALGMLGVGLSGAAFSAWIRGAIDAADEASKMAQKIGIATDKVAGLQLAFEQSGAGGPEVMQKAMSKLSVELVNGNKTLDALGIKSKDSREALALLADKFQQMPDGIAKSSAAAGIFGERIGANMIPLLNAGRQGLDEMDKAARDLGITIDTETGKAAERFNDDMDLVRKGAQGAALAIGADLLPVMTVLSKEMAEASKNGGALAGVGDALSTGLEAVVVVGAEVAFMVRGIAREFSMLAGQASALAKLDFAEEARIYNAAKAEAQADRDRTDAFNRRILQARAVSESVRNAADLDEPRYKRAMEESNKAAAARALLLGQQAEAAKKAAAEMKKLADAEKDRLSRAGLAQLKRFDEASEEDRRLTEAHKKAVQAEKELQAAQDLARQRRYDEAEAEADRLAKAQADAMKKADADILADWQRTVDQMGQSLADALMTGGQSVADYLKGLFRTLVLRPILMPAATAFGAAISGPAAAMGGGGAGSMLGSVGSALSGIGGFGAAAGAGASAVLGGAGLGDVLAGAGAMMGQGTFAGITGGLGMGLGAIAPYAMGALALYSLGKKLFGKKLDDAGITGTFSGAGFTGESFKEYSRIIGGDSTKKQPMSAELDAVFDAGATAARESVKAYVQVLGLPVEAMKGFTQQIKFSTKGQSAEETAAEIQRFVESFGDALSAIYEPLLKPFKKAGEDIGDTLQRLAGLQTFTDTIADLGGAFAKLAGLSFDARESLIGMAGGMDALLGKAQAFVQQYYNRDEIAGVKARDIQGTLADAGITRDFKSTAEFRKYLEGLDLSTAGGRKKFNALLGVAGDFADVAAYMSEDGTPNSLRGTAGQAPGGNLFGGGNTSNPNADVVGAVNGITLGIGSVEDVLIRIEKILKAQEKKPPTTVVVRHPAEVTIGGPDFATGGA